MLGRGRPALFSGRSTWCGLETLGRCRGSSFSLRARDVGSLEPSTSTPIELSSFQCPLERVPCGEMTSQAMRELNFTWFSTALFEE